MHLVIIGGSDAGTEAALRARQTDPSAEITVLVADDFANYSVCGLPFYVSGEVHDWRSLAHRDLEELAGLGIDVRLNHAAEAIDPSRKVVLVRHDERTLELPFDCLIVATGARPVRPLIPGLDEDGVFVLHTMTDGIRLRDWLDQRAPTDALVVGSGYIGVELADALTRRGTHVMLAGRSASVLRTVDPSLGELLRDELEGHGVSVLTGATVESIARVGGQLRATIAGGRSVVADIAIIGAGVRPNTDLAASAGVELGFAGAIRVTQSLETNVPGVYAAGDCVETWHAIIERATYLPLGTTAHKQGRVAGENAAGGRATFAGSIGTQIVKVFDLAAARTGLSETDAATAGFSPFSVETSVPDHKRYYPGATDLRIRLVGDRSSGRLLGGQIVGAWRAVAKRVDVVATALLAKMSVADLASLDLSYTPPVSAPWDPVQAAADAWGRALIVGRGAATTEQ